MWTDWLVLTGTGNSEIRFPVVGITWAHCQKSLVLSTRQRDDVLFLQGEWQCSCQHFGGEGVPHTLCSTRTITRCVTIATSSGRVKKTRPPESHENDNEPNVHQKQGFVVLATEDLDSSLDLSSSVVSLWQPLLNKLHGSGFTQQLLVALAESVTQEDSASNRFALGWIVKIITANYNSGKFTAVFMCCACAKKFCVSGSPDQMLFFFCKVWSLHNIALLTIRILTLVSRVSFVIKRVKILSSVVTKGMSDWI